MKNIEIARLEKTEDGIRGVLLIEGIIFCYTLEHPTKFLKSGTYPAKFEHSNKFNRKLYELKATGDRTEIKIHIGNTMADTEGCPLLGLSLGKYKGKWAVLESGSAVDLFHAELNGEDINVCILDLTGL
ncbi:MAG: hypothetical protein KAS30_01805 [Candidatus Diapherotrites archaeon]|nr:hypothetical protein [Candidatus Diapherotrites archaeon]